MNATIKERLSAAKKEAQRALKTGNMERLEHALSEPLDRVDLALDDAAQSDAAEGMDASVEAGLLLAAAVSRAMCCIILSKAGGQIVLTVDELRNAEGLQLFVVPLPEGDRVLVSAAPRI